MDLLVILFSSFGPFFVWPIEHLLPYPFIIEELFKAVVVWFGPKKFYIYPLAGIAFAVTETLIYSINIFMGGGIGLMLTRLLTSTLLHSATFSVIYLSGVKNKKLIILGFAAAALIHFLYNKFIPVFL